MIATWKQLTRTPDKKALDALFDGWYWLIDRSYKPVMFSVFGDAFLEKEKKIYWLNTGTGELTQVADTWEEFQGKLKTEEGEDWFLTHLADHLMEHGMIPNEKQCYSYTILPVFQEGSYKEDNFFLLPLHEHFSVTATILDQIRGVADGVRVMLQVTHYHILSGVKLHQQSPDTFQISTDEEKSKVGKGNVVKLNFEIPGKNKKGKKTVNTELMWVIVTDHHGDNFTGTLDNKSKYTDELMPGTFIQFQSDDIQEITDVKTHISKNKFKGYKKYLKKLFK